MKLTVGSLFAGIGGFDLGLERAGFEVRWQVEINPFCRAVLEKHWPQVQRYEDVRTVGAELERVDVLCGGFPCQPHSLAGRRGGAADERDLWPEFARLIRELEPRWVVAENVPGLLSNDAGRFFGGVLRNLAEIGYDAEWDCLPASAFGAPHRRDRVWLVAYPVCEERRIQPISECWGGGAAVAGDNGASKPMAYPKVFGLEGGRYGNRLHCATRGDWAGESAGGSRRGGTGAHANSSRLEERSALRCHMGEESQTVERGGAQMADAGCEQEGTGEESNCDPSRIWQQATADAGERLGERWEHWRTEPDVGRVAHGVPARVDRLRGLGNSIVPQIAEWIGRRILEAHQAEDAVARTV